MVVGRKTAPICAVCERPILDRFLLNVLDRTWHIKCVQCLDCKCPLTDKCYSREGKLYCREDFFRRFGTKCAGCSQGISPNDLVRRAKNKVFHLKCFTCMICRKQLSTGEELYILDDNKFICKEDYISNRLSGNSDLDDDNELESELQGDLSDKDFSIDDDNGHDFDISNDNIMSNTSSNDISVATSGKPASLPSSPDPLQDNNSSLLKISSDSNRSSPSCDINDNSITRDDQLVNDGNDGDETIEVNGKSGGATKRRGPRTTIKAKQLDVLKAAFMATPKPTRHIREQLAQETGLTMRVIQVWFQNKRSKERRMKQLTALGARRHFFRNPRRMRAVRGEVDDADMMGPGFGYFPDNGPEFFPGYQGYGEFFPGPPVEGNVNFMHPSARGTPPLTAEQPLHCNIDVDGQFIPNDHMVPSSNSPEPMSLHRHDGAPFMGNGPPRSLPGPFPTLSHPHQEMTEAW